MKTKITIPYALTGMMMLGLFAHSYKTSAATDNTYNIDSVKLPESGAYTLPHDTAADAIDISLILPYAVKAMERKKDVLYITNIGDTVRRTGGTRAWRNNNPGCLRYAEFARNNGAIGKCGGFAVFPDEETGRAALATLLRSNAYNKLSIAHAISKYAPPTENDVTVYRKRLKRMTGLSLDTKIGNLDSAQPNKVVDAICVMEGWRTGDIHYIESQANLMANMKNKSIKDSMQNSL